MTRKLSYCLYGMDPTNPINDPDEDKPSTVGLGGLFQWSEAFNQAGGHGVIFPVMTPELLDTFDIVHVNYTPRNTNYIHALRDNIGENSDTKIIANVDFAVSMWNSLDPYVMKAALDQCDFLFHVEPLGALRLSDFLGRKVYTLPHPVDVDGIHRMGLAQPTMEPVTISCQYHRYKDTWDPYFYAMRPLREEYGVRTALCNASSTPSHGHPVESLFDLIYHRSNYLDYLKLLSQMYLNLDIAWDVTYGRGIIDSAAMGIPTVGWLGVHAMNILFPELTISNPYNHLELRSVVVRLLDDPDFAAEVSKSGTERSSYFSLDSSYSRMVTALEEEELI